MNPSLKTTAEPAADPVVLTATTHGIEADKAAFSILWTGFISQWGPPRKSRGRRQHCWRVHTMLTEMERISEPYDGDDDADIPQEWQTFLETLPGFCAYWVCGCAWHKHGTV